MKCKTVCIYFFLTLKWQFDNNFCDPLVDWQPHHSHTHTAFRNAVAPHQASWSWTMWIRKELFKMSVTRKEEKQDSVALNIIFQLPIISQFNKLSFHRFVFVSPAFTAQTLWISLPPLWDLVPLQSSWLNLSFPLHALSDAWQVKQKSENGAGQVWPSHSQTREEGEEWWGRREMNRGSSRWEGACAPWRKDEAGGGNRARKVDW